MLYFIADFIQFYVNDINFTYKLTFKLQSTVVIIKLIVALNAIRIGPVVTESACGYPVMGNVEQVMSLKQLFKVCLSINNSLFSYLL